MKTVAQMSKAEIAEELAGLEGWEIFQTGHGWMRLVNHAETLATPESSTKASLLRNMRWGKYSQEHYVQIEKSK